MPQELILMKKNNIQKVEELAAKGSAMQETFAVQI
jgi:hypothetical protein